MYEKFYGLREPPFELTPNPKFLFLPPRHLEALSNLHYGLTSAKPITVLIGEAGTGKTTLLLTALASEQCRHVRCVYLSNPALSRDDFVRMLAIRFDLSSEARESKAVLLDELERVLRYRRELEGEITALVVDEAQSLSVELLEELRLLANVETSTEKLLPLVLAGQPELRARLDDPGLRQLKQRVALRCEIAPFELPETAAYIASRIGTAGGDASRLFTREAVVLIHEFSGGIPRTISVLCDNALMNGMALGRQPVDRATVLEVGRDFCLPEPGTRDPGFETRDSQLPSPEPQAPSPESPQPVAEGLVQSDVEKAGPPEPIDRVSGLRRFAFFRRSGRNVFAKPAEVLPE